MDHMWHIYVDMDKIFVSVQVLSIFGTNNMFVYVYNKIADFWRKLRLRMYVFFILFNLLR